MKNARPRDAVSHYQRAIKELSVGMTDEQLKAARDRLIAFIFHSEDMDLPAPSLRECAAVYYEALEEIRKEGIPKRNKREVEREVRDYKENYHSSE